MYKIHTFGFALSIALAFAFAFLPWHGAATSKAFSVCNSVAFAFPGVAKLVIEPAHIARASYLLCPDHDVGFLQCNQINVLDAISETYRVCPDSRIGV